MSLEDFIPFYDLIVGTNKREEEQLDEPSYLNYLFGQPDKKPDKSLSAAIENQHHHPSQEVYTEASSLFHSNNFDVYAFPLLMTCILVCVALTAKTVYLQGRPAFLKAIKAIQRALEGDEEKTNKMEVQMQMFENLLTNSMRVFEFECIEEIRKQSLEMIELQTRSLQSAQARYDEIINSLQNIIKVASPMRRKYEDSELLDVEQSGDSTKMATKN